MAASLFGSKLLRKGDGGKEEEVDTSTVITGAADTVVGLYFSAHWCPPCRRFTPALAQCYNTMKAAGKPIEIVFVSGDQDIGGFNEYYETMPWSAVPFGDKATQSKLNKKFKVRGIPHLVFVDGATGEQITDAGVQKVSEDPSAANFPWRPKTVAECLDGVMLKDKSGADVSYASLEGKHLLLYFSAHWCPPCQRFTPKLIQTYNALKAGDRANDFELVFVSSDRNVAQFNEYYEAMPWLNLPYAERQTKSDLSDTFGVSGIPSLVVLDADRNIVNDDCIGRVMSDPEGAEFPWAPKPVNDVEDSQDGLNDELCLLVMCEGCDDDDKDEVEGFLNTVAEEEKAATEASESKGEEEPDSVRFFTCKGGGIAEQIRGLCKLPRTPTTEAVLIVLKLENGQFAKVDGEVDEDLIRSTVAQAKAGSLDFQSVQSRRR